MVLMRNIIKLRREQKAGKLGARFKNRLVFYFVALSLLPVLFLFFATRGFINRSIDKWFGLPMDELKTSAIYIQSQYLKGEREGLERTAVTLGRLLLRSPMESSAQTLASEVATQQFEWAQLLDKNGRLIVQHATLDPNQLSEAFHHEWQKARTSALQEKLYSVEVSEPAGASVYMAHLIAGVPTENKGCLVIAQQVSQKFAESIQRIRQVEAQYEYFRERQLTWRQTMMQTLGVITLLVLFINVWLALNVARSIADPVRLLAQATQHVKEGDLAYRTGIVGDDELAALAHSFNEMTAELAENRRRLEERRRYIETILQNLSAGVISLDENNNVTTLNPAAQRLLNLSQAETTGVALEALLPEEQREELRRMIRRAARLHTVTGEVHFTLANNAKLDAAVTVTALHDPAGQANGTVIVLEDLTELVEAQRRAAWSEVARRMAHEIKNPLTPIRLSAERLAKNLVVEANGAQQPSGLNERQKQLVRECTALISDEVATLQRMVDEFSTFARLPNAKLEPASLNAVVESALKLYDERLNGVRLETYLVSALPEVLIDTEQLKRVLVNLIDNAAEAMADNGHERLITIETKERPEREAVELIVADTGPGIPEADRERIFDPYFSTRKRGTGLGLAIVSRIIAEHQGRIRVSDNAPSGARFTIELPLNN
jgi:two-component system nitrogen regulation sensor histidine kinase NtrY